MAKNNHIQVDLLYRWLPAKAARVLSVGVDLVRAAFFIAMVVLTVQLMLKMESYQMTIIDLPMNIVYGVCLFGLAMAALRSLWVMKVHWQRGYSVLEMVRAFEAASGRPVPYDIVARRPGDIAACWADPARAEQVLGWKAQRDLQAMCVDAWRWQSGNPQGYEAG